MNLFSKFIRLGFISVFLTPVYVSATTYVPISVGDITIIIPINNTPIANDDVLVNLPERHVDLGVPISVINNDTDETPSSLIVTLVSQTSANGQPLSISTDSQTIIYTTLPGWNGTDTFQYRVTDEAGQQSDIATASVTFVDANDPPVATRDNYEVASRPNCNISSPSTSAHVLEYCRYNFHSLFNNDLDEDSPSSSLRIGRVFGLHGTEVQPRDLFGSGDQFYSIPNGLVSIGIHGDIQFVPNPIAFGQNHLIFDYTVVDGQGAESEKAVVFFTFGSSTTNQPPSINSVTPANNASFSDTELIQLSTSISDPNPNDTVTLSVSVDGGNSTVVGAPYVLSVGPLSAGPHSITFRATDAAGAQSNIVTRNIQVSGSSNNSSDTFTASSSSVRVGQSVDLSWNIADANTCSLSAGSQTLNSNLSGTRTNYPVTFYTVDSSLELVLQCQDNSGAAMPPLNVTLNVQKLSAPSLNQPVVQ